MTDLPPHEALVGADPAAVLETLPAMGRVMVVGRAPGVTHERIGPVGAVARDGGALRLTGDCHDARVDLAPVADIRIDRRSVMREKVYPRLEFRDASGGLLFSVVGMEGPEPFEAALAGFARAPADPPAEAESGGARPDLAEDDPAHAPFAEAQAAGAPVAIRLDRPGLSQVWEGTIASVRPAMGFLNVMTPDFHLHLEGGSVSGWRTESGRRVALDRNGRPVGLSVVSALFA